MKSTKKRNIIFKAQPENKGDFFFEKTIKIFLCLFEMG